MTETLEKVGVISGIIAALFTLLPISIQDIPFGWNFIPVSVAIVILGITTNHYRQRKSKIISPVLKPILEYGRIIVRRRTESTHGGIFDSGSYHVEVINTTPNTVAKNCTGSIDIPETEVRNHVTMWEKDRIETIDIGHRELLHLFRVSVFRKESQPPETRLYFHAGGPDHVDRIAEERFTNNLDRRIIVLVQSHNADFPPESESFSRTVRQIINEAVE